MPTFRSLYDDNREQLRLSWIAGRSAADKALRHAVDRRAGQRGSRRPSESDPSEPTARARRGRGALLHADGASRRLHYANELIAGNPLGIVIGEGLTPPPELIETAERAGLPALASPQPAAEIIEVLRIYFAKVLAAHCTMHGV